jgi:hypothetical protein
MHSCKNELNLQLMAEERGQPEHPGPSSSGYKKDAEVPVASGEKEGQDLASLLTTPYIPCLLALFVCM